MQETMVHAQVLAAMRGPLVVMSGVMLFKERVTAIECVGYSIALVGFAALLLMVPLAATSFNRAIKALGAARWQALHRLVYATALLAILHFFWMRAAKNDFAEVAVYAAILAVLLGWRVARRLRQKG